MCEPLASPLVRAPSVQRGGERPSTTDIAPALFRQAIPQASARQPAAALRWPDVRWVGTPGADSSALINLSTPFARPKNTQDSEIREPSFHLGVGEPLKPNCARSRPLGTILRSGACPFLKLMTRSIARRLCPWNTTTKDSPSRVRFARAGLSGQTFKLVHQLMALNKVGMDLPVTSIHSVAGVR